MTNLCYCGNSEVVIFENGGAYSTDCYECCIKPPQVSIVDGRLFHTHYDDETGELLGKRMMLDINSDSRKWTSLQWSLYSKHYVRNLSLEELKKAISADDDDLPF